MPTPAPTIRKAQERDMAFLIDSIIAAEKSGTDKLSYSTIFGVSEPDLRAMLADILAEDVGGQELCVSGFLIAYSDAGPVGAACAWVEGSGTKSSALLKGNLLLYFLGRERIIAAAANLKLMEALSLQRSSGALQLESVHVSAGHRGQGIAARLLAAHQELACMQPSPPAKAQLILAKTNEAAQAAYLRAGFHVADERVSHEPRVLELLPAASKILMERRLP